MSSAKIAKPQRAAMVHFRVSREVLVRLHEIAYERGQTLSGMMEHLSRNLVRDADQRQTAEPSDLR